MSALLPNPNLAPLKERYLDICRKIHNLRGTGRGKTRWLKRDQARWSTPSARHHNLAWGYLHGNNIFRMESPMTRRFADPDWVLMIALEHFRPRRPDESSEEYEALKRRFEFLLRYDFNEFRRRCLAAHRSAA